MHNSRKAERVRQVIRCAKENLTHPEYTVAPSQSRINQEEERKMLQRKQKVLWLPAMVLVFALSFPALGADYPTKPNTLVIPFMAGAGTDLTGRALAAPAKKYLGQPIVCENIAGGGGTVGPTLVVKKAPDGHTIGIIASNTVNINSMPGGRSSDDSVVVGKLFADCKHGHTLLRTCHYCNLCISLVL